MFYEKKEGRYVYIMVELNHGDFFYSCHYQSLYYGEIHRDVILNQFLSLSSTHQNFVYIYKEYDGDLTLNHHERLFEVESLMDMSKKDHITSMKYTICDLIAKARDNDYNGISFVLDASQSLKNIHKHDFILFESRVNTIIKDLSCSILCFYNVEELNRSLINSFSFYHTHKFLTTSIEEIDCSFFHKKIDH